MNISSTDSLPLPAAGMCGRIFCQFNLFTLSYFSLVQYGSCEQSQFDQHMRDRHTLHGFFCARARCLSAGLRYLRLTRLPRHDRGPVPGGNRSAASCLCTVLRRALYHYATRSPTATLYMGYSSTANHQMLPSPRKEFGPQWCPSN